MARTAPDPAILSRACLAEGTVLHDVSMGGLSRQGFCRYIDHFHQELSRLGLEKGDAVGLLCSNSIASLALILACGERGIVFSLSGHPDQIIRRAAETREVRVVFHNAGYTLLEEERRLAADAGLPLIGIPEAGAIDVSAAPPVRAFAAAPDDVCLFTYTSGTTGKPKKVCHTHASLLAPSLHAAGRFYDAASATLLYYNFNHVGFLSLTYVPALLAGGDLHLIKYDHELIVDALETKGITHVCLFPWNWRILKSGAHGPGLLKTVRVVLTGGSLIDQTMVDEMLEAGAGKVCVVYGSTELLPPAAVLEQAAGDPPHRPRDGAHPIGTLADYVEMRRCPATGDHLFRGPNLCAVTDDVASAFDGGWYRVQDCLVIHGRDVYWRGRISDIIDEARGLTLGDLNALFKQTHADLIHESHTLLIDGDIVVFYTSRDRMFEPTIDRASFLDRADAVFSVRPEVAAIIRVEAFRHHNIKLDTQHLRDVYRRHTAQAAAAP
ncbi:MAG TPA: AMP-binding protein [Azospirillum sp.]|nr:AMP-binding protein [Azospirillum sp.]